MEVSILKKLDVSVKPADTAVESKPKFHKAKSLVSGGSAYGTGRRKNSVARVWVKPGKGTVTVNKRDVSDYFPRESYKKLILQPLSILTLLGSMM